MNKLNFGRVLTTHISGMIKLTNLLKIEITSKCGFNKSSIIFGKKKCVSEEIRLAVVCNPS